MKSLFKILLVLITSTITISGQNDNSFNITVTVNNLSSNDGKVFLALYDSEANFLGKSLVGETSNIENKQCKITFKGIKGGEYAVSIFHDENDNGKLDSNFLGIPKEDYGCSNDAKGFMGPPKWGDAKFQLAEDISITISL